VNIPEKFRLPTEDIYVEERKQVAPNKKAKQEEMKESELDDQISKKEEVDIYELIMKADIDENDFRNDITLQM
jgi:hypothetical protein